MITARDILYLWVLRMAMTSLEFVEQIPFKTVLVHPTILTQDGRRMSKSLGTGLNPLDLVAHYGADATRYCLLAQAGAVQDVRFDAAVKNNQVQASASAEAGRNFWQQAVECDPLRADEQRRIRARPLRAERIGRPLDLEPVAGGRARDDRGPAIAIASAT